MVHLTIALHKIKIPHFFSHMYLCQMGEFHRKFNFWIIVLIMYYNTLCLHA